MLTHTHVYVFCGSSLAILKKKKKKKKESPIILTVPILYLLGVRRGRFKEHARNTNSENQLKATKVKLCDQSSRGQCDTIEQRSAVS